MVDNAGTAAWRRNEDPREIIPIHDARIDTSEMHRIAASTNTYCQLKSHPRAIGIWGAADLVAKAKSLLEHRLSGGTTSSKAHEKFPRLPSLTPALRKVEENRLAAEEQRQRYRRNPPLGTEHEAIATMLWPDDVPSPEVIFGTSLQALDPVRLECSCYILYDNENGGMDVQAMGKKKDAVTAIARIRTCLYQFIARQMHCSTSFLMVQDKKNSKGIVTIASYKPSKVIAPAKVTYSEHIGTHDTPRLLAGFPRPGDVAASTRARALVARQVKDRVMQTLNKIKYLSGNISFNVQLGTLVMHRYLNEQDGQYTLAEFDKVLQDASFEGSVTQEIGDSTVEAHAWSRITKAKDMLETQSTFIRELCDVQPKYTAELTLDPNDGLGFLQVSKSWIESGDAGGLVEQTGATWYRLESHATKAKALLETCVVDLEDGLSWKFEIVTRHLVPPETLREALHDLGVYHMKIKTHEARDIKGNDIWCEFERNGLYVAGKRRLELRTFWEFGIKDSMYVVELSKVQKVTYGSGILGFEKKTVYEPRWSLQVKNHNWDLNFVQNANLGIGCGADWRADLETWFPMDDSVRDKEPGSKINGHVALMEKLFKLQTILRGDGPRVFRGMRFD